MPRTHGHTAVLLSRVTAFTYSDRPLPEHPGALPEAPEVAGIADLVAERAEDGACPQMGNGPIPGADLARLKGQRDLGIPAGARHLLGDWRTDGLHPRGGAVARRAADHRPAEHGPGWVGVAYRAGVGRGGRGGDDPRARALGGDRVRGGESAR